jgi:hypothetical protein
MDYDTAVGKVSEAKVEFYQKGKKTFEKEFDTEEEANIFKAKAFDMADTSAVELKEYTGKISMPKFVKDKNNPNFLNVYIKYDTGAGATMALGRETGSGQDRRNNAAEAMKLANDVARDLEAEYNIEDIDITDQENGIINIFAVSDDFVDMNPNMLGEATPADDGIAAAGGGTPADQGRAADKTDGLTTKAMNKILMNVIKDLKEGEPGLWDNIRAKRARGEKPSSKNSKAYKSAVAAGKRINKEK